jgi:hypothetical protein
MPKVVFGYSKRNCGGIDCKTHPDAPHGFDRNASIVRIGMCVSVKGGSRQSVNGLG